MKLNIKKNIFIGLKGLLVSIVSGIITAIARSLIVALGIAADSNTVWALALIVGIPLGLYTYGWLANKWFGWK